MLKRMNLAMPVLFGLTVVSHAQSLPNQPSPAATVQSTTPTVDPAAAALFEKALGLMASSTVRSGIHSALVTGTVVSSADTTAALGTFSIKFSDSNFQMESIAQSHRRRVSYVNGSGRIDTDGQIGPANNSGVAELYSDAFPLLDAWSSYTRSGVGVEAGTDTIINGVPCSEVKLRFPPRVRLLVNPTHDVRVFIDKSTGLLAAIDYPATQTKFYTAQNRMRVLYGEYRTLDGVYTPTLIRRYFNGQALPVLQITSLSIHQNFDATNLTF